MFRFDLNEPPPMPVSALLFCPMFMRLVHHHASWLVYPIARNAKRDAQQAALWLRWSITHYQACVRWLELNPSPFHIYTHLMGAR
jgi:aromatic ring-cleaving dioxygenase